MGRELKRVPLDFAWPQWATWGGYENPHYRWRTNCPGCAGSGYSKEAKQMVDSWQDWCCKLTQEDVDALWDANRLALDFTEKPTPEQLASLKSWDLLRHRYALIKARCARLGFSDACPQCAGDGDMWATEEHRQAYENWQREEPPSGPGYQIWETVSEGSPCSPVFSDPVDLADWMAKTYPRDGNRYAWLRFINGPGWCPSLTIRGGQILSGADQV